jgi:type III pantothenate kinase
MKPLLVNVGNTCTTLARSGRSGAVVVLDRRAGGYDGEPRRAARLVSRLVAANGLDDSIVCSVVPVQTVFWTRILGEALGRRPLLLNPEMDLGVRIECPAPGRIGADRLADVCAAVHLHGSPVMVVDIGTAATFNMVLGGGLFVGGAIAPGPALFTEYMAARTAQLPAVPLPSGHAPASGRTTQAAMQLALRVGYPAMVDAIAGHILSGAGGRGRVVLTGGYSRWAGPRCRIRHTVDPLLTLRGIARAYDLNAVRDGSTARTGG